MIVTLIPKEALIDVWPQAGELIQLALDTEPDFYTQIDILHDILTDRACLWCVYDDDINMVAAFTTSVHEFPLSRRLIVNQAGGTMLDDWQDEAFDILKNYARDIGCSAIDARGRFGWSKRAKERGWKAVASIYSFDLKEH